MKPKSDPTKSNEPAPKKRFRVEKLEERIAPAGCRLGHLNPQSKVVGSQAFC